MECKPPFLSAVLAQLKSQSGIHLSLFWFRFCVSLMCSLGAIKTRPLRLACISGDAATDDAMEQPYECAMMTVAGYLYRSSSSFFTSSTREAVVYGSQLDACYLTWCYTSPSTLILTLCSLGSCRNPVNQWQGCVRYAKSTRFDTSIVTPGQTEKKQNQCEWVCVCASTLFIQHAYLSTQAMNKHNQWHLAAQFMDNVHDPKSMAIDVDELCVFCNDLGFS